MNILDALRFGVLALAAATAVGCSDQESEDDTYKPVVMTDTDQDGVPDKCEAFFGTDPAKPDTDNDALADGAEDHDGDGYTNYQEMKPYADKDRCPPEPDGGKEAAADGAAEDAADGAQQDGQAEDGAQQDGQTEDGAALDAEADVLAETGSDAEPGADASDGEAMDAAAD